MPSDSEIEKKYRDDLAQSMSDLAQWKNVGLAATKARVFKAIVEREGNLASNLTTFITGRSTPEMRNKKPLTPEQVEELTENLIADFPSINFFK